MGAVDLSLRRAGNQASIFTTKHEAMKVQVNGFRVGALSLAPVYGA